ncbi:MAG: hypothetical protein ACTSU5_07315 [Promethearchaeota archaeon]
MPRRVKGFLVSRILVVFLAVVIPVVIWVTFTLGKFEVAWFPEGTFKTVVIKILTPLVYSASWLMMFVLFASRISATFDALDKSSRVIPLRLLFFYGTNALFILAIFVFPIITPVVSVLAFASLAWRLTTIRKTDWGEEQRVSKVTWVAMVAFSVFPVFFAVLILPEILAFAVQLWETFWLPIVDVLYDGSVILCTALTFGSLVFLVQTGVSEYEQLGGAKSEEINVVAIHIFEAALFAFFLFMMWHQIEFLDVFIWGGLLVACFVTVVNFIRGRRAVVDFKSATVGYVLAIAFVLAQMLWGTTQIKNYLLILTSVVFIAAITVTFFRVEDEL